MTNQNNELYQILNDFRQTSLVIQANDSLGRGELGAEAFKKSIETTEQQIQALYAPKPVENGELRETILSILGIVDRTSGNRPEQIATLEQELTAHTNAEIAKVLDTIESAVLGEVTDEEERYEVYSAIQAERAKIKGGVMNPTNEQELREILVNLANQIAANEQRLLNGNATREETINSDSDATMRAEKAIQAHTNAEIAKVLDRAKQRFHEPIEHDGSYISISVIDKTFDELIQAERAKLKEVK